jgi:hypothetical protein
MAADVDIVADILAGAAAATIINYQLPAIRSEEPYMQVATMEGTFDSFCITNSIDRY